VSEQGNTSRGFTTQVPLNLLSNIAYFIINIIIGLLLVPYFISTLGVAAYGLIPLATSITGYVALVISSLNTAVSRFLTVDLQKEDYAAANRTFNTSLFGLSAIIALMVPVVIAVSWSIPILFNVPAGQETEVMLLFLGVCMAFLIRAWSGNFTVQLFAYNRLDLQNIISIVNIVVQTGLILLLFHFFQPNLAFIGGSYLIGAIVASIVSIIFAKRVCPFLKISIRSFDRLRVKDLCGMGGWVVINQIGSLLFVQIDLIVVNMLFGATSAGEYAIALQWVVLLRAIAGVLSCVLTPVIFTYYARQQTDQLIKISKSAVKLMGLAMALPIGLVCGFAPQLLTVWVGSTFAYLAPLMIILTIHLAVNLAVLPLFAINVAFNKVSVPGIITLIMGIWNFALAIILSSYTGWGYYGVAIAGAIVLTLTNVIITPWYTARILKIPSSTFVRSILPGILAMVSIIGLAIIFSFFFETSKILILAISILIISGVYIFVLLGIGFNNFERNIIYSYVPLNLRQFIKK
jgi:membrane protein EpsK